MYRPLPHNLTIKNSDIQGIGLFSTENISLQTVLGISHHQTLEFGLIRTPLGGFINHSEEPNCLKIDIVGSNSGYSYLMTIKDILSGEELTLKYKTYDPTEQG